MAANSDRKRGTDSGMTLVEALAALAITGMLAVVGLGVTGRVVERASADSLCRSFKGLLAQATTRAVVERRYVGVLFKEDERGVYGTLYGDGDGDGIAREDIRTGVDRALTSPAFLREGQAFAGLPEGVLTDPMGQAIGLRDPVRFGRSAILSFGPLATATPGSLYLRDRTGREAWAFRVAGLGGRVRVFRWWKGNWSEWK